MLRATEMAQLLLRQRLKEGDVVVDATVGNGNDTLFLADQVGPTGQVIGFDVQKAALEHTATRLGERPHVRLVHAGHETLTAHLNGQTVKLAAVMFNLGYLPGTDKTVMTGSETTLAAVQQALALLSVGGLMTIVLYPGHAGGGEEARNVLAFAQNLEDDFAVSRYQRINSRKPAPDLLAVERRR
ncbi:MAG: class I SAM-dependent methyltransferase [Alphaproteobacteria bacterium]